MKTKLPEGWKEVELGKIFEFQKKSKIKAGDGSKEGKYKFFTSSDKQTKFIDEYNQDGEYLIFATGGHAGIHYCNEKFATSTDCFIVKVDGAVLAKYVYYYLFSKIRLLEEGFKGAGLKHISKGYIQTMRISYPKNIETQKKIVSILEKAENAKELRKEADELSKDYLKSVFVDMFGDPIKNNKKYPSDKLVNICNLKSGGTPSRKEPKFFQGKIPWITTVSLGQKYISDKDAVEHITEEAIKKSATKIIPKNSIMVGVRVGVGKASINECEMCTNQDIASLVDIDKSMNVEFLLEVFRYYEKHFESQMRGATIKGITSGTLKELEIIKPPIELQNKFASIVKQVEQMKEHQKESKQELDNLFNALMQKAFKGELKC